MPTVQLPTLRVLGHEILNLTVAVPIIHGRTASTIAFRSVRSAKTAQHA